MSFCKFYWMICFYEKKYIKMDLCVIYLYTHYILWKQALCIFVTIYIYNVYYKYFLQSDFPLHFPHGIF